ITAKMFTYYRQNVHLLTSNPLNSIGNLGCKTRRKTRKTLLKQPQPVDNFFSLPNNQFLAKKKKTKEPLKTYAKSIWHYAYQIYRRGFKRNCWDRY
ncbi:hypothetical protein, partial [Arsenophonus nasoniae]|uniref:hypothetical protein n=1 Tax=Arsenophonus nasoniae TaxID=638 RepID=UPI001B7FA593